MRVAIAGTFPLAQKGDGHRLLQSRGRSSGVRVKSRSSRATFSPPRTWFPFCYA